MNLKINLQAQANFDGEGGRLGAGRSRQFGQYMQQVYPNTQSQGRAVAETQGRLRDGKLIGTAQRPVLGEGAAKNITSARIQSKFHTQSQSARHKRQNQQVNQWTAAHHGGEVRLLSQDAAATQGAVHSARGPPSQNQRPLVIRSRFIGNGRQTNANNNTERQQTHSKHDYFGGNGQQLQRTQKQDQQQIDSAAGSRLHSGAVTARNAPQKQVRFVDSANATPRQAAGAPIPMLKQDLVRQSQGMVKPLQLPDDTSDVHFYDYQVEAAQQQQLLTYKNFAKLKQASNDKSPRIVQFKKSRMKDRTPQDPMKLELMDSGPFDRQHTNYNVGTEVQQRRGSTENADAAAQASKVGLKKRTLNRAMQRQELVYTNMPKRASEVPNLNFIIKNSQMSREHQRDGGHQVSARQNSQHTHTNSQGVGKLTEHEEDSTPRHRNLVIKFGQGHGPPGQQRYQQNYNQPEPLAMEQAQDLAKQHSSRSNRLTQAATHAHQLQNVQQVALSSRIKENPNKVQLLLQPDSQALLRSNILPTQYDSRKASEGQHLNSKGNHLISSKVAAEHHSHHHRFAKTQQFNNMQGTTHLKNLATGGAKGKFQALRRSKERLPSNQAKNLPNKLIAPTPERVRKLHIKTGKQQQYARFKQELQAEQKQEMLQFQLKQNFMNGNQQEDESLDLEEDIQNLYDGTTVNSNHFYHQEKLPMAAMIMVNSDSEISKPEQAQNIEFSADELSYFEKCGVVDKQQNLRSSKREDESGKMSSEVASYCGIQSYQWTKTQQVAKGQQPGFQRVSSKANLHEKEASPYKTQQQAMHSENLLANKEPQPMATGASKGPEDGRETPVIRGPRLRKERSRPQLDALPFTARSQCQKSQSTRNLHKMLQQFEVLDGLQDQSCESPIKPMADMDELEMLADLNALSEIRKTSDSGSAKDEANFKFNPIDLSRVAQPQHLGKDDKGYTNNLQGAQGSMSIGSKSKSTSNVGTTPKGENQPQSPPTQQPSFAPQTLQSQFGTLQSQQLGQALPVQPTSRNKAQGPARNLQPGTGSLCSPISSGTPLKQDPPPNHKGQPNGAETLQYAGKHKHAGTLTLTTGKNAQQHRGLENA